MSSLTALTGSGVTVPVFGFGMRPLVPRVLAILPRFFIMSGVATAVSNPSQPLVILAMRSSFPASTAPADLQSLTRVSSQKTMTLVVFPVPWGRATVPLSC